MHVLGQDYPAVDVKWLFSADLTNRLAQFGNVRDQQTGTAIKQIHGEEVSAARHMIPSIVGHDGMMPKERISEI